MTAPCKPEFIQNHALPKFLMAAWAQAYFCGRRPQSSSSIFDHWRTFCSRVSGQHFVFVARLTRPIPFFLFSPLRKHVDCGQLEAYLFDNFTRLLFRNHSFYFEFSSSASHCLIVARPLFYFVLRARARRRNTHVKSMCPESYAFM